MSTHELKPCPFCGGERITFGVDYDFDTDGRYRWLECRDCGARTRPHYHSAGNDCPNLRQEIRNEWNTRFPDPEISALKAEVERLRTALKKIADWDLPMTNQFWPNTDGTISDRPMRYESVHGSNGARNYIRSQAQAALEELDDTKPK